MSVSSFYNGEEKYSFGVPVGTILSGLWIIAPDGFLLCNGAEIEITKYPELAELFEKNFGKSNFYGGDGVETFCVPDLQGEFLRGSGTNSHSGEGNGANVGVHQEGTIHNFLAPYFNGKIVDIVIMKRRQTHRLAYGSEPPSKIRKSGN